MDYQPFPKKIIGGSGRRSESLHVHLDFLSILQFTPTVQKHASAIS